MLLGERWFPIPLRAWNHPKVKAYRESRVRFQTVHAGRRSFKTELAKRRIVNAASTNTLKRYFCGAPTRDQAKRIFWRDIKLLAPKWAHRKVSESELFIELINGCELWVIGFDKPERMEGTPWHGCVLSEFPHFKDTAWNESIAPALRDTGGWAVIEGVPEGRNHYYELSLYAKNSGDPEWADYHWTTSEVREPEEIAKEKVRLDERTFRQEYEGSFESYEGRAYLYYDSDSHRKPQAITVGVPTSISCDFNLDPCIWIIGQDVKGFISVQDEIKQRQTDIWKMCAELKLRLTARNVGARDARTIFYGDLEHGRSRSVSATASSWEIIKQEFVGWNVEYRLKGHPRIIDRVNSVNAKLRSADGKIHVGIDPRAVELHKDMEMVSLEDLQKTKTDTPQDRTHSSDCVGYWINFEYPVKPKTEWGAL